MSEGLNKWMGMGTLGADAELRAVAGGQSVLNFRIACNESYKDRDGVRKERCEWVKCALWGKRAEALAPILRQGTQVFVEGSLRTRSYEKDGEKRYATDVNVSNVILGASKRRDGGGHGGSAARAPNPDAPADDFVQDGGYGGDDSDIPFIRPARGMQP